MPFTAYNPVVIIVNKTVPRLPWALFAALFFVYCLFNSTAVAESTRSYLALCGERVVPALFVFSVLASLVCKSKYFYALCRLVPGIGTELALLLMGMLGGFPLGAVVASELYENGCINKKQGEYLCAFTNNPSLSFTVSFVGGTLGSAGLGIALAALCFVSSTIVALLFKFFYLGKAERKITLDKAFGAETEIATAIREGAFTMLVICACVVFFGSLGTLLPGPLRGFLELSGGIANCYDPVLAAMLLGFSGVSVMGQVAVVCKGKLAVAPFIAAKLLQSALMGFFAYFLFD